MCVCETKRNYTQMYHLHHFLLELNTKFSRADCVHTVDTPGQPPCLSYIFHTRFSGVLFSKSVLEVFLWRTSSVVLSSLCRHTVVYLSSLPEMDRHLGCVFLLWVSAPVNK